MHKIQHISSLRGPGDLFSGQVSFLSTYREQRWIAYYYSARRSKGGSPLPYQARFDAHIGVGVGGHVPLPRPGQHNKRF